MGKKISELPITNTAANIDDLIINVKDANGVATSKRISRESLFKGYVPSDTSDFLKSGDLSNYMSATDMSYYATQSDIVGLMSYNYFASVLGDGLSGYLMSSQLSGYGYLSENDLSSYGLLSQSDISGYGLLNHDDLASYNFLSQGDLENYNFLSQNDLRNYVTQTFLSEYLNQGSNHYTTVSEVNYMLEPYMREDDFSNSLNAYSDYLRNLLGLNNS